MTKSKETTTKTQPSDRANYVSPRVYILELDTEFHLFADMPGVQKHTVELTCANGELSISAPVAFIHNSKRVVLGNSLPEGYRRLFTVDDTVEIEKIAAEMNNGVLKVTLPKKESAQSRRIAISVN